MYPVYDTVEQGQEVVMLLVGLLEYECILYLLLLSKARRL